MGRHLVWSEELFIIRRAKQYQTRLCPGVLSYKVHLSWTEPSHTRQPTLGSISIAIQKITAKYTARTWRRTRTYHHQLSSCVHCFYAEKRRGISRSTLTQIDGLGCLQLRKNIYWSDSSGLNCSYPPINEMNRRFTDDYENLKPHLCFFIFKIKFPSGIANKSGLACN
jgi:hypothetical protein